jgi:polysaccharide biosynthesis protein PslH
MDLLYVTEAVPNRDPVHGDGSSMISFEVLRHLDPSIDITLVTFGAEQDVPQEVRARCAEVHVFRLGSMLLCDARSLISGTSTGTLQRSGSKSRQAISTLSKSADVTLLHGPHVVLASASFANGPLVVQVVDPWSYRSRMEAETAKGWRRSYWNRVSQNSLATEEALPSRARLLTVGHRDAERWSSQLGRPVRSIGVGVADLPAAADAPQAGDAPTICFAGSLNYKPNIESAEILAHEIAPRIWAEVPQARFVIAGRQPDPAVLALSSDRIDVRANVASISEVFRTSNAAVFPDQHGLGVRNSVTEALATGIPVFATPTAAREQPVHPLLHVAEDPAQLAKLVCEEIANPQRRPDDSNARLRGWDEVAGDYEEELALAQRSKP